MGSFQQPSYTPRLMDPIPTSNYQHQKPSVLFCCALIDSRLNVDAIDTYIYMCIHSFRQLTSTFAWRLSVPGGTAYLCPYGVLYRNAYDITWHLSNVIVDASMWLPPFLNIYDSGTIIFKAQGLGAEPRLPPVSSLPSVMKY